MDYYLNEQSLSSVNNISDAYNIMRQFVICCSSLQRIGMNALRVSTDLNHFEIIENYFVYQWRNDKNVDREVVRRFKTIITRSPIIELQNIKLLSNFDKNDLYFENSRTLGLFAAYLDNSIAISFLTKTIWQQLYIQATHSYFNLSEVFCEEIVLVHNISNLEHLQNHARVFKSQLPESEFDVTNPLPFTSILKFLFEDFSPNFYAHYSHFNQNDKIGIYKTWSKKVAELNWYEYNSQLSIRNNRDIYQQGEGGSRIYLALDTQHGRFECCNHQGTHKSEFDFYGNKTKGAAKDRSHDIFVK